MSKKTTQPPMSVNVGHMDSPIKTPSVYMRFFYPDTYLERGRGVLLFDMTPDFADGLARLLKNEGKKARKLGRSKQSDVGKEIAASAKKIEAGE